MQLDGDKSLAPFVVVCACQHSTSPESCPTAPETNKDGRSWQSAAHSGVGKINTPAPLNNADLLSTHWRAPSHFFGNRAATRSRAASRHAHWNDARPGRRLN